MSDTNADWWLRVRQQRDAVQPRQATDVELWRLTKGVHIAAAAVRGVAGVGLDLRLVWNDDVRSTQVYRNSGELAAAASAKREELLRAGWVDAPPHWQLGPVT